MAVCEVCGNYYDRININRESHIFDSFECAIHMLAPQWKAVFSADGTALMNQV